MPIGSGSEKFPPPWLIAMQRYGPPPSYPNLKIPGLNAPIPEACSFGYHAGLLLFHVFQPSLFEENFTQTKISIKNLVA